MDFGYRWSYLDKFNNAVLGLRRKGAVITAMVSPLPSLSRVRLRTSCVS